MANGTVKWFNDSKGFGFIEMVNKNEAESAIQALDGQNIMDRALTVNFARPRSEAPQRSRY